MWFTLPGFAAASYIPSLVLDRALYVREHSDGLYRVITYLLSKMAEELLVAGIGSCLTCSMVFYAVQLQGSWILFWLAHVTTYAWGIVLAFMVASISPNIGVANAALPGGWLIRGPFGAGSTTAICFALHADAMTGDAASFVSCIVLNI